MFFHAEWRRANSKARSFIFIKTNRGARERDALANQRKKKAKETAAAQRNMGACDGATQNSFHHLLFPDKFLLGAHLLTRRRTERHFFFCSRAQFLVWKSVSPLLAGVLKKRGRTRSSPQRPATENNYFATREEWSRRRLSSASRAILFFPPAATVDCEKSQHSHCAGAHADEYNESRSSRGCERQGVDSKTAVRVLTWILKICLWVYIALGKFAHIAHLPMP